MAGYLTLSTTELEAVADSLESLEVHHEVLRPLGSTASHGDGLSALEVGVGQSGLRLPLVGKGSQVGDDLGELVPQDVKGITDEDELRVVGDVARGAAQVDDAGGGRGNEAKSVDMLRWIGVGSQEAWEGG
jgi:hypothetical protein